MPAFRLMVSFWPSLLEAMIAARRLPGSPSGVSGRGLKIVRSRRDSRVSKWAVWIPNRAGKRRPRAVKFMLTRDLPD